MSRLNAGVIVLILLINQGCALGKRSTALMESNGRYKPEFVREPSVVIINDWSNIDQVIITESVVNSGNEKIYIDNLQGLNLSVTFFFKDENRSPVGLLETTWSEPLPDSGLKGKRYAPVNYPFIEMPKNSSRSISSNLFSLDALARMAKSQNIDLSDIRAIGIGGSYRSLYSGVEDSKGKKIDMPIYSGIIKKPRILVVLGP